MFRYLRYLVLALLAIAVLIVSLANRGMVSLVVLPPELADIIGINWAVEMPLFLVVLGGVMIGLLIGFVWEWLREHKHRALAAAKAREVARLEREAAQAGTRPKGTTDEVIALVDGPRKAG